jgi:hypothetical protein
MNVKSFSIATLVVPALGILSVAAVGCSGMEGVVEPADQESAGAASTKGQVASKALAAHPDHVLTPNGVFAHKACVHAIADGDMVDGSGRILRKDGSVQRVASCAYPEIGFAADKPRDSRSFQPATDNGWTETAYYNMPVPVGEYRSRFHVPAAPSYFAGQLIYIFPGLQGGGAILQTVIQYGNNGAWGGQYWSMNTWAGGGGEYGGNYYYGNVVRVNTGDTIANAQVGHPNDCNQNGCAWDVVGTDLNNGQTSSYKTYINISWTQVLALAIEVYGVDRCDKYPATYDNAWGFYVQQWGGGGAFTTNWQSAIWVNTCGESITGDKNLINLYY